MQLEMRIQSLPRDTTVLADDALGESLVELLRPAVPKRRAPAVATITRPQRIDFIGLAPVFAQEIPVEGFIASLTRAQVEPDAGDARAVGVMGVLNLGVPTAVVFLEWPDNRWWLWRSLIDPSTRELLPETETLTRAIDGDPMPPGLGRWWSLARRRNLRASLRKREPTVH